MSTGASHTLGSKVWVTDAESGWVKGDVVKVDKGNLIVTTASGTTGTYKPEECPLQNPQTAGGVEVKPVKGLANAARNTVRPAGPSTSLLHMQVLESVALSKETCNMLTGSGASQLHGLAWFLMWCMMHAGHDHAVIPE